jgi:hypothetical protein
MLVECPRPSADGVAYSSRLNGQSNLAVYDRAVDLRLLQGIVPDRTVSFVAQHGFQEADLQGLAEIKHTEAVLWSSTARVAETARRLAETEWVRMMVKIDVAEVIADRESGQIEVRAGKVGGRMKRCRHSTERVHDALGRLDGLSRSAFGERFATREASEFGMMLDQEAVDRPRATSQPIK